MSERGARSAVRAIAVAALATAVAAGCGGGEAIARVELATVSGDEEHWALEAVCSGGTLTVEFEPGRIAVVRGVDRLASASYEAIAIECSDDVRRVSIADDPERHDHSELGEPQRGAIRLTCRVDGPLEVSVNPVWGDREPVVGASLAIARRDDRDLVAAAGLKRDGEQDWSRVAWSRRLCEPA